MSIIEDQASEIERLKAHLAESEALRMESEEARVQLQESLAKTTGQLEGANAAMTNAKVREVLDERDALREQLADSERVAKLALSLRRERDETREQLGEAERRAANSESLRDGALDRLAEVERERDGLQRPRAGERLKMWDRLYAAVGADDDWTAEQVVRAVESLAGAAQPVVEPRDETKPPPGYVVVHVHPEIGADPYWLPVAEPLGPARTRARAIAECHEHAAVVAAGYAHHPSGTEGPLREALQRVVTCLCDDLTDEPGSSTRLAEAVSLAEQVLAASPPGGTAPERAPDVTQRGVGHWSEDKTGGFICEDGSLLSIRSDVDAVVFGDAQGDLGPRLVPLGIMRKLLATRPPDGTAPERVPVKCIYCGERDAVCIGVYECGEGGPDPACDECCGHGNEDGWCVQLDDHEAVARKMQQFFARAIEAESDDAEGDATRPPDGTLPERAPDDRAVIVSIRDGLAKHFEEEAEEYADDEGIREGLLKAAELLRTTGMVAAEYGTATRPPDGMPGEPDRGER